MLNAIKNNPVRVAAFTAAVIVFVAASFGIVIDEQSVEDAIIAVLPIIFTAEVARSKVTPVK